MRTRCRIREAAQDEDLESVALHRLEQHDAETLTTYLAARGDTAVASARLHLHPNTVRCRLRKLASTSMTSTSGWA
jgi:DNA-binding PucR family transcriptional regulator